MGSVVDALVDHGIQIPSEAGCIDSRCSRRCFSHGGPGHESARANGPELCHGRAVTRDDEGPTGLHFSKDSRGLIAQLPLSDNSIHGQP